MNPTESGKAKGKVPVLKLKRETLRELDALELKQAQGAGGPTRKCQTKECDSYHHCTRGCSGG
jgi:hypothetical protein